MSSLEQLRVRNTVLHMEAIGTSCYVGCPRMWRCLELILGWFRE